MRQLKGSSLRLRQMVLAISKVVVRLHVTKTVRRQTYPALCVPAFLSHLWSTVILGEDEPASSGMEVSRDPDA